MTVITSVNDRSAYQSEMILGRDRRLSTDSWQTQLNNNMLVIGPSGSGKTRSVLKPNLLQCDASFIVIDTKGTLRDEMGVMLEREGYRTCGINFAEPSRDIGYNPLDFIQNDSSFDGYSEQDVLTIAKAVSPVENLMDRFWDNAAANLIACLVAFVMETRPRCERTLSEVIRLCEDLGATTFATLKSYSEEHPMTFAGRLFRSYQGTMSAEKMNASILGVIAEKMMCLGFNGAHRMYRKRNRIDFSDLCRSKTALFVTVSDIDHTLAPLINLFITQAFQAVEREADRQPGGRLPWPVRFFLDDFGNLRIPCFDDILSVIRSREIYCSVFCQTVTQLARTYGHDAALSIIGNCDTQIALGFQDIETASHYAPRANKTAATLMRTPLDKAWLFVRGRDAELVDKYAVENHPRFMSEEDRSRCVAEQERVLAELTRHWPDAVIEPMGAEAVPV